MDGEWASLGEVKIDKIVVDVGNVDVDLGVELAEASDEDDGVESE
jgi:hypothetical protein